MYKLLVVDDEPAVRLGLRNYVDWGQFDIKFAGEADDGDTGLEAVERLKPDIVLTDVRMPNVDGISLSKEIRKRFPNMKIVFVSGHDDSDYLKSAMKVSAVDYIFKPVNLQELRTVIARVVAELEEEQTERRMTQQMQAKLQESMPLLREKFLLSLILNGASRGERIQERLDFLGLVLPYNAAYWVIVVSVDRFTDIVEKYSERDLQIFCYAIQNVCQEVVCQYLQGSVFEHRSDEFVGIVYTNQEHSCSIGAGLASAGSEPNRSDDPEELLFELATQLRDHLQRFLRISVTIGIGDRVSSLDMLAGSYEQAREAAAGKWYLGQNQILTMDSLNLDKQETFVERSHRFDSSESGKLISLLKGGDSDQLGSALDELMGRLARQRRGGLKYSRNVILQIVLLAGQLMLELNLADEELERRESWLWEELFKQETIDELRQLLEAYLQEVCGKIRERRSGRASNIVERVREIIERRYADNKLTVSEIGREVYLTDTYISLLFKQETGRTVNEWLTLYRMEKAKELLANPAYKLYDICYAVGYADPSYFSKLFKKVTGLTPSVYRETRNI
ncbi:response regulator [Paenibacillus mesophilus]|uniref:response regulator n=1 Tax=Paenibacillus mesophilus TaxID=2582849 RepID=UPI00110EE4C8|nr:response regulator [Paenibacillus mesophilus]TMV47872.1 response regulator [Paenibacillus mesophilus]